MSTSSASPTQANSVLWSSLTIWPSSWRSLLQGDQTALTIAKLLVEHVLSPWSTSTVTLRLGSSLPVPLSQRGVQSFGRVERVNTSTDHPQRDGLVERFYQTLTSMLLMKVEHSGRDCMEESWWIGKNPFRKFMLRRTKMKSWWCWQKLGTWLRLMSRKTTGAEAAVWWRYKVTNIQG